MREKWSTHAVTVKNIFFNVKPRSSEEPAESIRWRQVVRGGTSQHVISNKLNGGLSENEAAGSLSSTSMS
jgi:hypothetical protein